MITLPQYTVLSLVYQGIRTVAYQAIRLNDRQRLILKTQISEYPELRDLANLNDEYQLLKDIDFPGIIKVIDLIKHQNRLILVLEDVQGITLKEWRGDNSASIEDFFTIAIQLAEILIKLHNQNIIHKDIKPANILINPKSLKITLIDFSLSSKLSNETSSLVSPNVLEGTLAYLSPEQTGRMNRLVDYRSDFYSLGVTFYKLLTGCLPFESQDPLELIYCHLAKMPIPPHKVKDKVPAILSDLVLKMMAKSSDDRYMSAWGIKSDLVSCQEQWLMYKKIDSFELGKKDIKKKLIISQKLYGREEQIHQLFDVFERLCEKGKNELILVAGPPGIGKTAFIQEVYKPLSRHRGYFIKGKFDFLQKNISYFGLIQAFKELMQHLLAEKQETLDRIRQEILEVVGPNGQVIIDLIPELELIIGKQPAVATLQPVEAQNRFLFVFQGFVRVFAQKEHPLVLFIDDLQWADQASLNLIEQLLDNGSYFLMMGAYRDTEVQSHHPLLATLEFIKSHEILLTTIFLAPLDEENIRSLIEDSFGQTASIQELPSLVFKKTRGNPFFINEFLKTVYREKLLALSENGIWKADIAGIQNQAITDNVVDLLVANIQKLAESSQQILTLASAIGGRFNLRVLSIICQKGVMELSMALWPAVEAELIIPIGTSYKQASLAEQEAASGTQIEYKFLHDRVQEAAYSLIPLADKKRVHLKIGRLLLDETQDIQERLFDILSHLNFSVDLIENTEERKRLGELNYLAGKKAKASTAYEAALNYYQRALSLLPENAWEKHNRYTFELHKEFAECEYLVGHFEEAEKHLEELVQKTESVLDKADIYNILVAQLANIGRNEVGVQKGLKALELLGLPLPRKPSQFDVLKALARLKWKVATTSKKRLQNLPPMTDPVRIKMMDLLLTLGAPAYLSDQNLFAILGLNDLMLTIDHGFLDKSADGIMIYIVVLITALFDFKEAKFWKDLLMHYIEGKTKRLDFFIYCTIGGFYVHWYEHFREVLPYINKALQSSIEEGDFNYLLYSSIFKLDYYYAMGIPLSQTLKVCEDMIELLRRSKDEGFYNDMVLDRYLIHCFYEKIEPQEKELEALLNNVLKQKSGSAIFYAYTRLVELYYFKGNISKALETTALGDPFKKFAASLIPLFDFEYYKALSLAAAYPSCTKKDRKKCWKTLKYLQKLFKMYSKQIPVNHLTSYLLICAEIAALQGKDIEAASLYNRAIKAAKESEFIHRAAVASECAGRFYLKREEERLARIYLEEAHYYYLQWEVRLKVEALEKEFPHWLGIKKDLTSTLTSQSTNTSYTTSAHAFDFMSVLKANRAISSEIVLNKLLETMMKILMENSGSQRGLLIVEKESKLWIEAEVFFDKETVLLDDHPVTERQDLPTSLIAYVARTQENIVLSDASVSQFAQDPYVVASKPKSIICTPILYRNKLIGILYLENNSATGAFTTERIEVLNLLSSQAAISLENARLYNATGRFVPVEFLQLLNKRSLIDVRLGDQIQRNSMSVLFCDIRNFTGLSETMTSAETFAFINEFLGYMEPHVKAHGGFIDKFIGDAIMALFDREAEEAMNAAIGMLKALHQFNIERQKQNKVKIAMGIGINTGELILGILGGKERFEGSVMGDAVNTASRIEDLTKVYGTPLLIGEKTKIALLHPSNYALRMIDEVMVKGKSIPMSIWEVCDVDLDDVRILKMNTLELFTLARSRYLMHEYEEARELFQQCSDQNPHDRVVQHYLNRCVERQKTSK